MPPLNWFHATQLGGSIKRIIGVAVAMALGTVTLVPIQAVAQTHTTIIVREAPPPLRREATPPPRRAYEWTSGYWNWTGRKYVWTAGHWERERYGHRYQRPEWRQGIEHDPWLALQRAMSESFDTFLLDIGLPGMDGTKLARRLRAMPVGRTSLMVAITGYGQHFDRSNALQAEFDHYFVKPIEPSKLLVTLLDFQKSSLQK